MREEAGPGPHYAHDRSGHAFARAAAADDGLEGLAELAAAVAALQPDPVITVDDGGDPPPDADASEPPGRSQTFHTVPAWLSAPPPENTRAFDLGGAYGALASVDLAACKADGLAAGYGKVVVGFDADGAPASVSVVLPGGSADGARGCVEGAFRNVRVAPFDGSAVTVQRSFFVKA